MKVLACDFAQLGAYKTWATWHIYCPYLHGSPSMSTSRERIIFAYIEWVRWDKKYPTQPKLNFTCIYITFTLTQYSYYFPTTKYTYSICVLLSFSISSYLHTQTIYKYIDATHGNPKNALNQTSTKIPQSIKLHTTQFTFPMQTN